VYYFYKSSHLPLSSANKAAYLTVMQVPFNYQTIKKCPVEIGDLKIYLVWFDSYGAKSSCIFIETPDLKLLVDPGAAVMQPRYPLSDSEKEELRQRALDTIATFSLNADTVFISHYHYDHYTLPLDTKAIYRGKTLWIKDPNQWINHSQWERARLFLTQLHETYGGNAYSTGDTQPEDFPRFDDPVDHLPIAMAKDYGDYQQRKNQLLGKGRNWFKKLVSSWQDEPWMSECILKGVTVRFADGRSFKKGSTSVRFTEPMFHGIEYDRVGWVIGLTLEHGGRKVIYASDLQGPGIEDYAHWIINENPDVLILDGPATYLFGFIINRINLQRAIDNVCTILDTTTIKVVIYDHHLLREARYRERLAQAYNTAGTHRKTFLTAAEWLGQEPLIEKIAKKRT